MRYINTKTRAVLDSPCAIFGGDWVPYDKQIQKEEPPKVNAKSEDDAKDEGGLTKDEIMNELDALGIEYDKKAKKDDLYRLMMGE